MSLIKSLILIFFGFWLGLTYADPGRRWQAAHELGRGLAWAGERLVDLAESHAQAYANRDSSRGERTQRPWFG